MKTITGNKPSVNPATRLKLIYRLIRYLSGVSWPTIPRQLTAVTCATDSQQ